MLIKRWYLQLEKGEKIILVLKRHWFIFFKASSFYLLLFLIPPLFYFISKEVGFTDWQLPVFYPFMVMGLSTYYLLVCTLFFYAWSDYHLDTWIVTNYRVIDINQKGLFHRLIAWERLSRVQDVASEVKGMLPTFLNFGNVYIQTAGEKERFKFEQVTNPFEVARKINQLTKEENLPPRPVVIRK